MLNLGDTMPNIKADSTIGPIELFDYFGSNWGILFSHPKDFTPVCTTELGRLAQLAESFEKRGVKIVGLSVDTVQDHKEWTKDIEAYAKAPVKFPLLADPNGDIARLVFCTFYHLGFNDIVAYFMNISIISFLYYYKGRWVYWIKILLIL